jgi:hypothetical protein
MIPIAFAIPPALAPLASHVGSLGWMAHTSTRT